MLLLPFLFKVIVQILSIYTFMCFIRIIITWFPTLNYSPFGKFLGALCDPFLNFFGRLPLRFGALDFSPMLAIGFLSLLSTVFSSIAVTGRIHIGGILAYIVLMLWSIFSSILVFFIAIVLIRLISMLISKRENGSAFWSLIDAYLYPIVKEIASHFYKSAIIPYKRALIVSGVMGLLFFITGKFAVSFIAYLLNSLPL